MNVDGDLSMPGSRGLARHVAVLAGFGVLAAAWSFPLVLHLETHLPGQAPGDNMIFLWNFWWMRIALASGEDFFHTHYLFAPAGADLTLHTHAALPALIGATVLRGLSVVTALNITILAALALNGFCAYLLAWRVTRDRAAAVVAGVIFGASPYLSAHLNGHFNLTTAWTIPLFALTLRNGIPDSVRSAVLSGAVLALTAYVDYYYVVYEVALAGCLLLLNSCEWSVGPRLGRRAPRWCVALVSSAIAVDVLLLLVMALMGRGTFNLRQLFWVLVLLAIWLRWRPRVSVRPRITWSATRAAALFAAMMLTFMLLAAPLLWNGVMLIVHGQYVTQRYFWRSSPVGVDALTFLIGNPFHGVWGWSVRRLYASLRVSVIESGGWLGIVPVLLSAFALRRRPTDPDVRRWLIVGAVFLVWALGSHLFVAGRNTGMILPEALLRYVPIASNARIPGRAMVVVYLALAVLASAGVAAIRATVGRAAWAPAVIGLLVFADFNAAPFPLTPIQCPGIYQLLRDRPEPGAVAELPLGMADGLGALTFADPLMQACQTVHQRPLVGGFIARLPPAVVASYADDPLLAAWLELSRARTGAQSRPALPDRALAVERLRADGIAFIMLNRRTAAPALREYVEHVLPLDVLAEDEARTLYLVASAERN
jgi:hypothetical protein